MSLNDDFLIIIAVKVDLIHPCCKVLLTLHQDSSHLNDELRPKGSRPKGILAVDNTRCILIIIAAWQ